MPVSPVIQSPSRASGRKISSDITREVTMPDLLIRNFPAAELHLLDEQAKRLGLSRTEFLRRQLVREARRTQSAVTAADLAGLADLVADLDDPSVMRDAWP